MIFHHLLKTIQKFSEIIFYTSRNDYVSFRFYTSKKWKLEPKIIESYHNYILTCSEKLMKINACYLRSNFEFFGFVFLNILLTISVIYEYTSKI